MILAILFFLLTETDSAGLELPKWQPGKSQYIEDTLFP